jgi:hypothetical protein
MEMTAVWKGRKRKSPFPPFPHCLGKLANSRASHIPTASATTWNSYLLQARLTSTSTKSVTHMPSTFCYRHARSHMIDNTTGFSPSDIAFLLGADFSAAS